MNEKIGSDTTPNSVVNAALTYLTPLQHHLKNPPPGRERFASEVGLAVGNFPHWIQPKHSDWKAKEFTELFQAFIAEARYQPDAHKFPVRITEVGPSQITITISRADGKPVGPFAITAEGGEL